MSSEHTSASSEVGGSSALDAETINGKTFASGWAFNSQKLQGSVRIRNKQFQSLQTTTKLTL
jgi:hypothetical protein